MDRMELATTLHALARTSLSDAVTRAVNRGDLKVAPLPVRAVAVTPTRRGSRRRTDDDTVQTAGVNAWALDDATAVALARGGILIKDAADGVFVSPTVAELAEARDERELAGYLADAEELIAVVLGHSGSSSR
ncbi:hypothetical protein GRS96_13265 [Rathayibacter sp. VKM Ac-2803]|uniref:hypothetical protein n=1 Tax=unclassified Rathayibacter TaxID=2609250 RepID=UPI00135A7055|nr:MULTISPECIES: hypothetical protein [unclassified Rathayibacter]MWV50238.1 hypothetical protein [Rathayibacter sp. VKM Ac-2803]MWV60719.1 hypothetical protein [Rathayibacter sp. VKM Ac-2754]